MPKTPYSEGCKISQLHCSEMVEIFIGSFKRFLSPVGPLVVIHRKAFSVMRLRVFVCALKAFSEIVSIKMFLRRKCRMCSWFLARACSRHCY